MSEPISPASVKGGGRDELPAYVANGVVGLRVREMPLAGGLTLVNGYTGEHPKRGIEAIAVAPYPVAGDIQIAGVWLSDAPHAVTIIDQSYDFYTGELRSRFQFKAEGCKASIEVLTPTTAMSHIAIQEAAGGVAVVWMDKVTDEQYLAGPGAYSR